MISIPLRQNYLTKDGFAQACHAAFENLKALYDNAPIENRDPEWSNDGQSRSVFHIALPLGEKMRDGAEGAMLTSLRNHLVSRRKKELRHIARVEKDGFWIVWAETD